MLCISPFAFSQQQQAPEKEITIKVTVSEAQAIVSALQERPFKEVSSLINKVIVQANAQLSDTTKRK